MTLMLVLFGLATLLELLLHYSRPAWKLRGATVVLIIACLAFATGAVFAWWPNGFSGLILILTLYRAYNLVRVVFGRMHENYLQRVSRTTSRQLIAAQLVTAAAWWMWDVLPFAHNDAWHILTVMQGVAALVLAASTLRRFRHTEWPSKITTYTDKELPTLTVAIPARNETEDLEHCLRSLLNNNYPKLEIIVLDDCSQSKRLPEIIREFAHDGVRFIQGHEPSETWLPKNQAYERLSEEASGSYILFCGVDTRFDANSLRELVSFMLDRRKKMVSLMPFREQMARSRFSLIQPMRYWWELAPPRRLFNRPPVLSSCWIIERQALNKAGGFRAVTRAIIPEAHFAKSLLAADAYSFMRSSLELGISSAKLAREQRDTLVRLRYPQMHKRPEQVLLVSLAELVLLAVPFALAVAGFWLSISPSTHLLAGLSALLLAATYAIIAVRTRINTPWFALLAFPAVVLTDIVLLHYSMWRYEFSTVDWKGRNVCIPVMHVVPHLPNSE